MEIKRTFLGWEKPLCETVPAYLLAGAGAGMLDLRGTVVVVPTRQSSWRLRAALPLAADARGAATLGPEIVTPAVLLEPRHNPAAATSLQSLLAWLAVLKAVKPGELSAFLGAREGRTRAAGWALQVARRLQDLRGELADGGFAIADLAERGAEIEESERWAAMADLERRYAGQLAAWRLRDAIDLKLEQARQGLFAPQAARVVVAAVPDPPKLFMTLLERWSAAGGALEILLAAPQGEAGAFDAWGRPLPEAWHSRGIGLRSEDLWLEATPDDQAARIAQALAAGGDAASSEAARRPQLAVGVPDRETVAPLQRELAAIGLPAFDPQNRPLSETTLFRLVQALLALRDRPAYAELAALLRHPDIIAFFGTGAELLRELDKFQSEHLPVAADDLRSAPALLRATLARVQEWRATLKGADLAAGLRAVMQQVYAQRTLKSGDPADDFFQQAVSAFDAGLRELEGAAATVHTPDEAAEVLMARLQEATVKAERREQRLDLEGWLELAWNPAPLLFVAGMNEGFVPDGHVGDLFLPDTLRHQLGLRDDRLRVARDAYVLTALLGQRRIEGRVILLAGKTSTAGDPLRPSRLLFRCPDRELVARARMLFKDPPASHAAEAFTVSFKLDPARLPAGCIDGRRARELSPTIFRDYLACPLRFYLRHVLGMNPLDDRAREPDAPAFGNLVHDVLKEMGQDRRLWACGDGDGLARWLEQRLGELSRARYGARPWLGVELAMGSAAQRLRAFAQPLVAWHAGVWEIVQSEKTRTCAIGGLSLTGRIDRIDKNARTGALCVLDYKTSDKSMTPQETHFAPPREADDLDAAAVPAQLTGGKREKRWADLQLPLYRELVQAEFGSNIQLGYICLPNALGDTGVTLWEQYSDALHASAIRCAQAVILRIKQGVFWPPGKLRAAYNDDLSGVLLDDPGRSIAPPAAPWRTEA